MRRAFLLAALALAGCDGAAKEAPAFPPADRPVASIISARWSNEEARDRVNEADKIMDLAGIDPGMTIIDTPPDIRDSATRVALLAAHAVVSPLVPERVEYTVAVLPLPLTVIVGVVPARSSVPLVRLHP